MKLLNPTFLFGFLLLSISAFSSDNFGACKQVFANQKSPIIDRFALHDEHALCIGSYAVLYSGESKTPIYAAEYISNQIGNKTLKKTKRKNNFHPEKQLSHAQQSKPIDYLHSGYDQGHMAPAGDMATQPDIDNSFSMANMIPQNKFCNEHPWKKIESDVRKYARRSESGIYVITGPVFESHHPVIGPGKVWVPQYVYKLVYDQNKNKAWAYWIINSDAARATEPISYSELVKRTHIKFIAGYVEKP